MRWKLRSIVQHLYNRFSLPGKLPSSLFRFLTSFKFKGLPSFQACAACDMAANQHPNIVSSFSTYKRLLLNHTSHCDPFYLYKVEHSTPLGRLRRLRFMPWSEPLSCRPIAFAPLSFRLFNFDADGISGRKLALSDATNLILPMGDRACKCGRFFPTRYWVCPSA